MNAKHLTNYMKDHFSGSVAAVELLDHLISFHRGKPTNSFSSNCGGRSGSRNPEWITARSQLLLEDPSGGQLARLEKLEALALGIDGKASTLAFTSCHRRGNTSFA